MPNLMHQENNGAEHKPFLLAAGDPGTRKRRRNLGSDAVPSRLRRRDFYPAVLVILAAIITIGVYKIGENYDRVVDEVTDHYIVRTPHAAETAVPEKTERERSGSHTESYEENFRATQIENYRRGVALMINIHVTHHGGTAFCRSIGHALDENKSAPRGNSACNTGAAWPGEEFLEIRNDPWKGVEKTKQKSLKLRKYYHMIGWEYHAFPQRGPLKQTDWEGPNVLSVIIMRHPMSRMLAKDESFRDKNKRQEDYDDGDWSKFAMLDRNDNYALRILADDKGCCSGADTSRRYLDGAKELLRKMTYVLDIECLGKGMRKVAEELDITMNWNEKNEAVHHVHESSENRITNRTAYNYLVEKNKLDIELYEW
eukprot:CAMPEP_0194320650 /NCGR_PEP_ID=MMETSP0171-20130528/16920_1 /TAXON_ID=218684 /ORGANISM="Corethron pennatum, Strain L29A3" /LENGTH=369 /DNA_ID=CAMNT_0039078227 /DNA_START=144 /DNA_END=1250 /DNA_ORIENTATION=+